MKSVKGKGTPNRTEGPEVGDRGTGIALLSLDFGVRRE
jgi:hypothetical protein